MMDNYLSAAWIEDTADDIATRHVISPIPVQYLLQECKLRPEVVELFATMADWGYSSERIVAAAQALTGETYE